ALAAVQHHEPVLSLADDGSQDLEWHIVDSACTYVGAEPWGVNHHTWQLRQVERIACTTLQLGPLALQPYDYTEALSADGVLSLGARAAVSDLELVVLRDLHVLRSPLDVTRTGVSDSPRRMLVDDYVWGTGSRGPSVVLRCRDVVEPRVTLASSS